MKAGETYRDNATSDDPLEELYAIRRQISELYENDVHKVFEAACERQRAAEAHGVKYIRLPVVRWGKVQTGFESTLPLCACEDAAEYKANGGDRPMAEEA